MKDDPCEHCGAECSVTDAGQFWRCGCWKQGGGYFRSVECRDRQIKNLQSLCKDAALYIHVPEEHGVLAFVETEQSKLKTKLLEAAKAGQA